MYIREQVHNHFLNLLEDKQFAVAYFQRKDISEFNKVKLKYLQDNLKLAKKRYSILYSMLSMLSLSKTINIKSIAAKLEKARQKQIHSEFELDIFESDLAYLIISGLINIDYRHIRDNFEPVYLEDLLEKYKKQILQPFKEYDYDEKTNSVSEISKSGYAIILPYTPECCKRI